MSAVVLTILSVAFALFGGPHAVAAEDLIRVIQATGRAAIVAGEDVQTAKGRALEDALYQAALTGGAKINGFSAVQADTRLDDHFVVRPSNEIVDYAIIDELYDDLHYEVQIQAAVGKVEQNGCFSRTHGHIVMFAPRLTVSQDAPAWLVNLPHNMTRRLIDSLSSNKLLSLEKQLSTVLKPKELTQDQRFRYAALTQPMPTVRPGDFAVETQIVLQPRAKRDIWSRENFIEVVVQSKIYTGEKYDYLTTVSNQTTIALGRDTMVRVWDVLSKPRRSRIVEELMALVPIHAADLSDRILCTPLHAVMQQKDNRLHVRLGTRHGVAINRLGVVSGDNAAWSVVRVVKADSDGAELVPLNKQRQMAELDGKAVTFLEMN
jgi:hypothetical protein